MFGRTAEPDPRPAAPSSRNRQGNRQGMRKGHRREYAADRARGSISFSERCDAALTDIGVYGAVSYRDLAEARFGGHPHTTRKAVNDWIRKGWVKEHRATGPKGNPFKVLSLTRKGLAKAREKAARRGIDPAQRIGTQRMKPAEAGHDTAIYRATWKERQRLEEQGATVRRVRLDAELKSAVARASEAARLGRGRQAADDERRRVANELGLPVDDRGKVLYPDAQIEYEDAEGRTGRVNVEAVSGNYREPAVRAKAAAGFAMHANGPAAAALLGRLGLGSDNGSWLSGPADRNPASVEL